MGGHIAAANSNRLFFLNRDRNPAPQQPMKKQDAQIIN
jgi:hypothetical protein